jgi:hypothetical protein
VVFLGVTGGEDSGNLTRRKDVLRFLFVFCWGVLGGDLSIVVLVPEEEFEASEGGLIRGQIFSGSSMTLGLMNESALVGI